ncbi:MAG: hypothetical protein PHI19_05515 [Clostridia bacterium]|nr:hypothetical protein [Clostridia bacterium]
MILSEIVDRAIQILGLENEVSVDVAGSKLTKLTDCVNMIIGELTQEYIHLKQTETLVFSEGRAYYTAFSKQVREVLSVKIGKSKQNFIMYPLYLYAEGLEGNAEVTYLYHLGSLSLSDTVELPPQYSVYTLAIGTVSEYCFRTGLVDEALFYKSRYDSSLMNLSRRMRLANLPSRRLL